MNERILIEMLTEAGCAEPHKPARYLIDNGVIVQAHGRCVDGRCSVCGLCVEEWDNYCPECGAKMDLEG